jgi:2-polyprenyl-3-methyl-5-hydroxy-6-metoxy-1,4-benzoquinol methylase
MSFSDPYKDRGHQFLGVVILEATDHLEAIDKTWKQGLNPGGEVLFATVSGIEDKYLNRLLPKEQALHLGRKVVRTSDGLKDKEW